LVSLPCAALHLLIRFPLATMPVDVYRNRTCTSLKIYSTIFFPVKVFHATRAELAVLRKIFVPANISTVEH
jgi:hypothetical protein